MVDPRMCVVEVTQIVPADDVPYVAARVAERLGMPLERVRKLIDDRTGPITRSLRPDKAEVIAQTFEAAGVVVAIRPAVEEDEFPLLGASSDAAPAPTSIAASDARDESESAVSSDAREVSAPTDTPVPAPQRLALERPTPSDATAGPSSPEMRADEPAVADLPAAATSEQERQPEPPEVDPQEPAPEEAGPDDLETHEDGGEETRSDDAEFEEFVPDDAEFEESVQDDAEFEEPDVVTTDAEAEDAARPVASDDEAEFDEPGTYDVEPDDLDDDQPAAEPDDFGYDDLAIDVDEGDGGAVGGPDDEPSEGAGSAEGLTEQDAHEPSAGWPAGDDGARPWAARRPPMMPEGLTMPAGASLQLDPDVDEDDDTDDPGPTGWPARGEVTVRPVTAAVFAASENGEGVAEPVPDEDGTEAQATNGGAARAVGVGGQTVSEGSASEGSVVTSDGGRLASGSPFGDPSTWHGDDDPAGGWTIGARATRRLPVVTDEPDGVADLADERTVPAAPPMDREDVDHARSDAPEDADVLAEEDEDRDGVDEASDPADEPASEPTSEPASDPADEPASEPASEPTAPLRVVYVDEGAAARTPRYDDPPLVGRGSRIRDRATEGGSRDSEQAAEGATAAPIPTAWRGLGSAERGPARPVDARLPRRGEYAQQPRREWSDAARVTRRRTLMLVVLAVALGVFVLAQAWVAGRAAPAFDAGLHRFRDADFGAARRVWTDLASHGDANAQFMLGYMSEAGLGRPWSARAAAAWYRLAADAGHAEAQWRLGNLYHQGLGVPPDTATAERWWAAALVGGHAEAAFTLGRSRLEGASGASDPGAAMMAFERAAALGWPAAVPYRDVLQAVSERPHQDALP